jgi:hypothetical protein
MSILDHRSGNFLVGSREIIVTASRRATQVPMRIKPTPLISIMTGDVAKAVGRSV